MIYLFLIGSFLMAIKLSGIAFGEYGLLAESFSNNIPLITTAYVLSVAHLTIVSMSLSFHRYHTHKGIIINKYLDSLFQIWLWLVTGMSKRDWVSVHIYHHAHSDKKKDPHSPVQKGLWRVFFGGAIDYSKAKSWPSVAKLRKAIPENKLEAFINKNQVMGPVLLTTICLVLFGPFWGAVLSVSNFLVSPLLAVGGVNAIAHYIGYRNHNSGDNSRNVGFLFPLNFIICGELDHNNHHKYPRSCSFRHKWYEFDIGYAYITILNKVGLAEIKNVYNTKKFKEELAEQMKRLLEYDVNFKKKCNELARELDLSLEEYKKIVLDYIEGKKTSMEASSKMFMRDLKRAAKIHLKMPQTAL